MTNSKKFKTLSKRITQLRKNLLPPKFLPTGIYEDRWNDRTKGFLLLCHAEIEFYLESMCKEIILRHYNDFINHEKTTKVLLALGLSYKLSWHIGKEEKFETFISEIIGQEKNIRTSIQEVLDKARDQYLHNIRENHGIREKNIKTLLIPLGIDMDQIDTTLMAELDSFGKIRGEYAHKGNQVIQLLDPKSEYERVKNIRDLIKALDKVFVKLNRVI